MEEIFKKYPLLRDQNVPRETLVDFEIFVSMLKQIKPKTMGQALRIDGITPAAVYILLSHVKRKSIKLIA